MQISAQKFFSKYAVETFDAKSCRKHFVRSQDNTQLNELILSGKDRKRLMIVFVYLFMYLYPFVYNSLIYLSKEIKKIAIKIRLKWQRSIESCIFELFLYQY